MFQSFQGGVIITGEQDVRLARLITLKSALTLEAKGIKVRPGVSAFTLVKREFGLKGNKAKVLAEFTKIVEEKKQARLAQNQHE